MDQKERRPAGNGASKQHVVSGTNKAKDTEPGAPGHRGISALEMLRALPTGKLAKLTERAQWMVCGDEKVPVDPRSGRHGKTNDPATWATFGEALAAVASGRYTYLGYVFAEWDPFFVIDWDDKLTNPATPEDKALLDSILAQFPTYTERSASGRGLHLYGIGKFEGAGVHTEHVEVYSQERFMVITGNVVRDLPPVDCHEMLGRLVNALRPKGAPANGADLVEVEETLTDQEVIEMATGAVNADKFTALCNGEWKDVRDGNGILLYPSQSEADFALLAMLCFYSKSNAQVRRLFRYSVLGKRDKAINDDKYLDFGISKIRAKDGEPLSPEAIDALLAQAKPAAALPSSSPTPATTPPSTPPAGDVVWEEPPPDEPEPALDRTALHGGVGEYVKWLEPQTEAHPAGMLAHFLARFGAAVGRGPFFLVGTQEHHARLWPCMVGMSAFARKGLSGNLINHLFNHTDDKTLKHSPGGLSSGEGLISRLQANDQEDDSALIKNERVALERLAFQNRRIFVQESEFSSVLAQGERQGNTLSATLRNAWDGERLAVMTRNNPLFVEEPHVVVVSHITRDELVRRLNTTEIANGFANRFLWVFVKRTKLLPSPPVIEPHSAWIRWLEDVVRHARTVRLVERTPAAQALWEQECYGQLSVERRGLLGALAVRGAPYVMRIAMTYALLDGHSSVDVPHLKAAMALWKYSDDTCRWIWGNKTGDPIADRILDVLRQRKVLTRTDITDLFNGRQNTLVQIALDQLHKLGRVKKGRRSPEGGRGRPTEVWVLTE